jgi:hypothetical protein
MTTQQIEHTSGRYEFRVPTGGILVLADPPEAGWVLETPLAQEVGRPLVLPERDRRPACDPVVPQRGARR